MARLWPLVAVAVASKNARGERTTTSDEFGNKKLGGEGSLPSACPFEVISNSRWR